MPSIKGSIHNPELRQILNADINLRQVAFMPIAPDPDWFKTSQTLTAGASTTLTTTSFTKAYCPGWPVAVTALVVDDIAVTDFTAGSMVVIGVDQFGDTITETAAGVYTSGTGWAFTTLNAFQSLVSVAVTMTGTAGGAETLVIGFNKTYGFGCRIKAAADVITKMFDGAADAGTTSIPYNTYVVAGTPNAAKNLILLMRPGYYFT